MIHGIYRSSRLVFPPRHRLHCCIWFAWSRSLALLLATSLVACATSGPSSQTGMPSATPKVSATPTIAVPTISKALVTYRGHWNNVDGVAWSPDSKRVVSCSDDGTVQAWNAQTGKMLWQTTITQYVFVVAWSPDGKRIAAAGSGEEVAILDATTGHRLASYVSQSYFIEGLVWSPDSRYLALGSQDNTVKVWDTMTSKLLLTYTGHKEGLGEVAWSPDGRRIASASHDGTVQVWDAKTGQRLLTYTGHAAPVWSVAWSPDGRYIVSGTGAQGNYEPVTANNSVRVWNSTTGQTLLAYPQKGQAYGLAWSPDGTRIASGDDKIVRVWNATSGQTILLYRGHTAEILDVAWAPDGTRIASSSLDETAQVWHAQA